MDNQQERREAAIYLAAMIQGEGSVMAYWNRTGPKRYHCVNVRVVIYNTDPETLDQVERCMKILDAGHYRYNYAQRGGDSRKQLGTVMVNGYKRLVRFLPWVIPFLVSEKKKRAEILLELAVVREKLTRSAPYTHEQEVMLQEVFKTGKRESSTTIRSASVSS